MCRLRGAGERQERGGRGNHGRGVERRGGKCNALSLSLEIKGLDGPDRGRGEAQRHCAEVGAPALPSFPGVTGAPKQQRVCAREVGWPSQNQPTPRERLSHLCTRSPGLCVTGSASSGGLTSPFYPPTQDTTAKEPASPPTHGAGSTPAPSARPCGPPSRRVFGHDRLISFLFPQPSLPLSPLSIRLSFSSDD